MQTDTEVLMASAGLLPPVAGKAATASPVRPLRGLGEHSGPLCTSVSMRWVSACGPRTDKALPPWESGFSGEWLEVPPKPRVGTCAAVGVGGN